MFLSRLKSLAQCVEPKISLNVTQHDPDNNKFLECAQEVRADFLITGNTKRFPPKRFKKTLIVSPVEFLSVIVKAPTW